MFIRGSGSGQEHQRVDNSFYRGIVVKNNDPNKLHRVKVYIPELTNQPYDDWIKDFDQWTLKSPGSNTNPTPDDTTGTFEDVKLFDEICKMIPWAEQCSPLFGESGNFRFFKDGEISTISDCNYVDGFQTNDKTPPTLQEGSFSPSFLYENEGTVLGDAFGQPLDNFSVKCNPYAFSYRPSNHVNMSKGVYGVPEVGSKVWVFHYEGDLNFPVYFGVMHDFRSLTILDDTDNEKKIGPKYPTDFEN